MIQLPIFQNSFKLTTDNILQTPREARRCILLPLIFVTYFVLQRSIIPPSIRIQRGWCQSEKSESFYNVIDGRTTVMEVMMNIILKTEMNKFHKYVWWHDNSATIMIKTSFTWEKFHNLNVQMWGMGLRFSPSLPDVNNILFVVKLYGLSLTCTSSYMVTILHFTFFVCEINIFTRVYRYPTQYGSLQCE